MSRISPEQARHRANQILQGIAKGKTGEEIASAIGVSYQSVDHFLRTHGVYGHRNMTSLRHAYKRGEIEIKVREKRKTFKRSVGCGLWSYDLSLPSQEGMDVLREQLGVG